jgi:hypothetical protein
LSPVAGNVQPDTLVTLTSNEAGTDIYYTLDGSDPRASGGGISPMAIKYTGPFTVSQTTQVIARSTSQSPVNAVDGDASTKYLNPGEQNTGLIITPASGPSIVRSMRLTTANDAPESDPSSYEIYGTNSPILSADNSTGSAENWTLISAGTLQLPTTRLIDGRAVSFPNSTSYTSYKIIFPTVRDTAAADSMQVANVRLYESSDGTGTQIQSAADRVLAVHVGAESDNLRIGQWSERVAALYSVETPANASNLRVTELHFHPANPTPAELALAPGSADGDYEFLELRNISNSVISLNGVEISGGIEFEFNNGSITSLQPRAYVLVVSNMTAFTARYGTGLPVAGQYLGQLSNGGEALLVSDAAGQPINDFTFDDVAPWPMAADGDGPSMEVVNFGGNYNSGTTWAASATPGGTPGWQATAPGDFNDNGMVDGSDFLVWQRGLGTEYAAADLPIWRANFGNGPEAAAALAAAGLILSTAAETPETATMAMALITTDHSSGNAVSLNAADSDVIGVVAHTRDPWWFVVENGELASSKSRGEIKAAATDAALAEWAPRHRSSFVADDFCAAVASNDHGTGDDFAALNRFGSAQRSLSLGDDMRLNLGGEVVFSWRSCWLASSCHFGPC